MKVFVVVCYRNSSTCDVGKIKVYTRKDLAKKALPFFIAEGYSRNNIAIEEHEIDSYGLV